MLQSFKSSIFRLVATLAYSALLAFILLGIGYSDGKVLDFAASARLGMGAFAISAVFWIVLLSLPIALAIVIARSLMARLTGLER